MIKRILYIIKQRLYVLKNASIPNQGKVYMFHNVDYKEDTYSIKPNNFMEFVFWLKQNKKIVTPNDLLKEKDKDNVVITFDDAFESVYKNAYPILKKFNLPYVIFMCTDFLNKDGFLNEDQLKEMLTESKCILGSHSKKHELHRFLDEETSKLYFEESKQELEDKFETKVNDFAFPYGSMYACSDENIELAMQTYKHVFMTYALPYNEVYGNIVPRINMNDKVYKKEMK